MIQSFGLIRDHVAYKYLCQNNNNPQLPEKVKILAVFLIYEQKVHQDSSFKQAAEFKTVMDAFKALEFDTCAIESIWKLVAVILHLGNLEFYEDEKDHVMSQQQLCSSTIQSFTFDFLGTYPRRIDKYWKTCRTS